jgi:hypothetical protein
MHEVANCFMSVYFYTFANEQLSGKETKKKGVWVFWAAGVFVGRSETVIVVRIT